MPNMLYKIMILTLILLIGLGIQAENIPEDVYIAAQKGLTWWALNVHDGSEYSIDLSKIESMDDIARARLGQPHRIYKINAQDLLDYERETDFLSLLELYYYRFPILIDTIMHGNMTLEYGPYAENGDSIWFAFSLGPRTKELDYIYMILDIYAESKGYTVFAFFIEQKGKLYLLVKKEDKIYLTPIMRQAYCYELSDSGWFALTDIKDVMPCLKRHAEAVVRYNKSVERTKNRSIEQKE